MALNPRIIKETFKGNWYGIYKESIIRAINMARTDLGVVVIWCITFFKRPNGRDYGTWYGIGGWGWFTTRQKIMDQHVERIASALQATTYTVSGGLVVSDWLSILDHHAAAFGVLLGTLTFLTNLVFQWLNHRAVGRK